MAESPEAEMYFYWMEILTSEAARSQATSPVVCRPCTQAPGEGSPAWLAEARALLDARRVDPIHLSTSASNISHVVR